MTLETAAQRIVFAAIDGLLTGCTVYDAAPQLPEGQPDNVFPYCVIGDDTLRVMDADDILGADATVTLHFWSRYAGRKQIKTLMGEAYALLHRASLTDATYKVVDCTWEFSTTPPVEADGKTRHGVQRYRLKLHRKV